MSQTLTDILRKLPHSGPQGFEGLIAALLSSLTGQQFDLAQAGTQEGRDMSSRHPHANVIAVECKRYQPNTTLDERELLGEIVQATIAIPDLDLWVLVASRTVPSQLRESLQRAVDKFGVELLIISDSDGLPSSLDVLCAHAPTIVVKHIQQYAPDDVPNLQALLIQIASTPESKNIESSLKDHLINPLLGYDNWRGEQNRRLIQYFESEDESRAHLGQLLNIAQPGTLLVERHEAWQKLDTWIDSWKNDHRLFVIRGEEGDGKTWATASWLHRRIIHDTQYPPVIFLSSADLQTNEPLDILVNVVAQHSVGMNRDQVLKRTTRWLQNSFNDRPLFLLIFDGINERHDVQWWRGLLEKLNVEPWNRALAVITTCRTGYWQYFTSLRSIKATPYTLQPYDDRELDIALATYHLRRDNIHKDLLPLARKPRYFDLLVQYRERLTKSGDVTVARLIYEDWRDRFARKRNLVVTDSDFQNLLRELVTQYLDGKTSVPRTEFMNTLPSREMLEELRTSGVFREHNGKFQIQPHHLIFSLALLLVDEVEDASRTNKNLTEIIAGWLEPQAAMDIKAQICEAAALRALEKQELPSAAKVALLHAWIINQNISENTETNLSAYFPVDPTSYFELAEAIWSEAFDHGWAQKILMQTFLRWLMQEEESPRSFWRERFERWLGFVNRFGYSFQRIDDDEDAQRIHQEICERLGGDLPLGPFSLGNYQLTGTDDDGLMRLGRVALALISHVPREPYIHALATSCVAEAIMDLPSKYDELAWIIRTSRQPLWSTVRIEVEQLLNINNRISQQAAYRLLSFLGNREAYQLQKSLPTELFPPRMLTEEHKSDPCNSGFSWKRSDCERCVTRTDISPDWLARQIKQYCIDPHLRVPEGIGARLAPLIETIDIESMHTNLTFTSSDHTFDEYEPALCAYAPQTIVDVVRRLVRHIAEREGAALRQLSFHLKQHSLLLTQEENDAIYQAWSGLHKRGDFTNDDAETAEMFLFPEVLAYLDSQAQFNHLIIRPEQLRDRVIFEDHFKPMNNWEVIWQTLSDATSEKALTRILWFITASIGNISSDDINTHIYPLLNHQESFVRALSLRLIYISRCMTSISNIICGSWSWSKSNHDEENLWGSLILSEYGSLLTFSDIILRVHPAYLGYAVRCRGSKPDEIPAYVDIVNNEWLLLSSGTPNLPSDFPSIYIEASTEDNTKPIIHWRGLAKLNTSQTITYYSMDASWGGPSETRIPENFNSGESFKQQQQESFTRLNETINQQMEADNVWFAQRIYADDLKFILHASPDIIEQWVSDALGEVSSAVRRLQIGSTFYEALCETLLQSDTHAKHGIMLYRHLQSIPMYVSTRNGDTKILLLDYTLFKAPPIEIVQQEWQHKLEQSTTDQELLEVIITAQSGNGTEWLWSYIVQALQTDIPLIFMRAITLLGFIDTQASFDELSNLLVQVPDTWQRKLVNRSQERWQRNSWAKHWFRRFLTVEDDAQAWAAFRLLLRCIDRRFWLWQSEIVNEVNRDSIPSNRLRFLDHNKEEIRKRAKKNENNLEKLFLGHKVIDGQLWPWM